MAFFNWHAPCICNDTGPEVGSDVMIKGNSNVCFFRFRPRSRHGHRRCLPFRAAARLGRNLAADRLKPPRTKGNSNARTLPDNRGDAKVMGVAAGIADYSGIDPTIVRLGLVALTLLTGPVMIFFYVLTGLLAPHQ